MLASFILFYSVSILMGEQLAEEYEGNNLKTYGQMIMFMIIQFGSLYILHHQ